MKPSCGIVAVAATAIAAAPSTALAAWFSAWLGRSAAMGFCRYNVGHPSGYRSFRYDAIGLLHARAFDAAQHRNVAMRQRLAQAKRVHPPRDQQAPLALIGPESGLGASEMREVWQ